MLSKSYCEVAPVHELLDRLAWSSGDERAALQQLVGSIELALREIPEGKRAVAMKALNEFRGVGA